MGRGLEGLAETTGVPSLADMWQGLRAFGGAFLNVVPPSL